MKKQKTKKIINKDLILFVIAALIIGSLFFYLNQHTRIVEILKEEAARLFCEGEGIKKVCKDQTLSLWNISIWFLGIIWLVLYIFHHGEFIKSILLIIPSLFSTIAWLLLIAGIFTLYFKSWFTFILITSAWALHYITFKFEKDIEQR